MQKLGRETADWGRQAEGRCTCLIKVNSSTGTDNDEKRQEAVRSSRQQRGRSDLSGCSRPAFPVLLCLEPSSSSSHSSSNSQKR